MDNSQDIWAEGVGEVMKGGRVYFKQEGDFVHGYYKGCEPAVGNYGPTFIHKCIGISGHFHDKDGNKITILKGMPYTFWDADFWHDEIAMVLDGQEFGLRYNGKKTSKKGNNYNDYTLKRLPGMAEVANFSAAAVDGDEDESKPDIFADSPFPA